MRGSGGANKHKLFSVAFLILDEPFSVPYKSSIQLKSVKLICKVNNKCQINKGLKTKLL